MTDHHNRFLAGVFIEQLAKISEPSFRTETRIQLQLPLVAQFVANERCSLGATLERTGNNGVDLHIQRGQSASDVTALLDAFLVEGALLVFLGIDEVFTGAGVT